VTEPGQGASARPIRFGVLGAARIVEKALLDAAKRTPGVEVTAIAARDVARAREYAKAHAIPVVHASYADVVHDPDLDAIYVPLPNSLHAVWSLRALDAGKHVLCEKPVASNAAEAARIAQSARASGRVFGEAFHYRYHPLAARVREIVAGGALGRIAEVSARFAVPLRPTDIRYDLALAGGATMDLGCYVLQMLRHFTGEAPRVVAARAREGPPGIDVEMTFDVDYESGAVGRGECAMHEGVRVGASFEARGERGSVRVTNPVAPHIGNQITLFVDGRETTESVPGDTTFVYQLRAFAEAVRGGAPFPSDAAEGVENMERIDAVYRKAGMRVRGAGA
jgi:predicted dehydrogenase